VDAVESSQTAEGPVAQLLTLLQSFPKLMAELLALQGENPMEETCSETRDGSARIGDCGAVSGDASMCGRGV
jgi:hypothetical protein